MLLQFGHEAPAFIEDIHEQAPQCVTVDTFRRLTETFLTVAARGNQVVEGVSYVVRHTGLYDIDPLQGKSRLFNGDNRLKLPLQPLRSAFGRWMGMRTSGVFSRKFARDSS